MIDEGGRVSRSDERSLAWRKSVASNPSGNCVELAARRDGSVAMRNSRDPQGPRLVFSRADLAAFVAAVRRGEFEHLA